MTLVDLLEEKDRQMQMPTDADEANQLVEWLGVERREKKRLEAEMNDQVASLKAMYEGVAAPRTAAIKRCEMALREWAETNRDNLTDGRKRKSFKLPAGVLGWRNGQPRVTVGKKRIAEVVLAQIRAMAKDARGTLSATLLGFIRQREEINKEAMLAAPEIARTVPGVKIKAGGEEFYVSPVELELTK